MSKDKKDFRIVYMGTPEFAVRPLEALLDSGYNVVGVVTVADKPAGRGKKLQSSPVKIFAQSRNIPVLQPVKLRDTEFLEDLNRLSPDLQIVVAFRMLPDVVWKMPSFGTFNLHASLLPQYRGAAPINHAIINGEKETGVTTFFIDDKIDTGSILLQEKIKILDHENAGSLHDRLMELGAGLVVETTKRIMNHEISPRPQSEFFDDSTPLKDAPKIFKEDCLINWNQNISDVFNKIRGLSPYPAAFAEFTYQNDVLPIKIFDSEMVVGFSDYKPGVLETDGKTYFQISCSDGILRLKEIQLPGKKRMPVPDFLRGFKDPESLIPLVSG